MLLAHVRGGNAGPGRVQRLSAAWLPFQTHQCCGAQATQIYLFNSLFWHPLLRWCCCAIRVSVDALCTLHDCALEFPLLLPILWV